MGNQCTELRYFLYSAADASTRTHKNKHKKKAGNCPAQLCTLATTSLSINAIQQIYMFIYFWNPWSLYFLAVFLLLGHLFQYWVIPTNISKHNTAKKTNQNKTNKQTNRIGNHILFFRHSGTETKIKIKIYLSSSSEHLIIVFRQSFILQKCITSLKVDLIII